MLIILYHFQLRKFHKIGNIKTNYNLSSDSLCLIRKKHQKMELNICIVNFKENSENLKLSYMIFFYHLLT